MGMRHPLYNPDEPGGVLVLGTPFDGGSGVHWLVCDDRTTEV